MFSLFRLSTALLILTLILPSLAGAQELAARDEITVIGTRSELALDDAAGNIAVVNAAQLDLTGANHIQQALSLVPGANYHRGNGQESLPAIRSAVLTGAGACGNVLVLEEAVPVRSAGFCNVNELFDTHFEQARRIEVVRGAGSAFYGSNALLGSINVHLPIEARNHVAMELGPHEYRRASASWGYSQDEAAVGRFFLTVTDDGGYRDDSGYQQQKLSWRHRASFEDWSVTLGATATFLDQETAGFIVGDGAYLDEQGSRRNLDPEAFRKTDSIRAWARIEREFDHQTLSITPYVRATKMDFLQHFLPGDPLEQNEQDGIGIQSSLLNRVSPNFTWTVGLDGEIASGELLQTQDLPTQGSAFLQATIPAGKHYDYAVDATQLAAFTHADWSFADRWRLVGGIRLETIEYDYDNRMPNGRTRDDGTECGFGGCRYNRPADRKDRFTHLSPKLELRYQATEQLRWHIAIADSFRAPQATELYRLQRAQSSTSLEEVRATHIETGLRWTTPTTDLNVSLYRIDQSNVIIRDSDFFNVDGQKIDSEGFEAYWRQQLSDRWSVTLVSSLAKHKYGSNQFIEGENIRGNRVDTAPELVGNLNLDWQASEKHHLQAQVTHVSDYFLEPNNRFSYPGHTLLNLRSSYQITPSLKAALRLLNVFDKRYAKRADYTSFSEQRYFPGEPRALYGELKLQF